MSETNLTLLGEAHKWRTLVESDEWLSSWMKLGITVKRLDEAYEWLTQHIATQPLIGTNPYTSHEYRLWEVELWERSWGGQIVSVLFKIEDDDERVTLLFAVARAFNLHR